jgi:hypothetical protein
MRLSHCEKQALSIDCLKHMHFTCTQAFAGNASARALRICGMIFEICANMHISHACLGWHRTCETLSRARRSGRSNPYKTEISMSAIIGGAITCVGGILAASSVIAKMRPNAKELIDKLVPYQGSVGGIMFVWGIWETISVVGNIARITDFGMLNFIFEALVAFADLLVGFLLAFGLITKFALSKNPVAMEKGQQLRGKLASVQIPLGFLAIIMGVLYIVVSFL